ncbi:MAG: UPF0104 family protein [Cyanobacteria bacterium J06639_1]
MQRSLRATVCPLAIADDMLPKALSQFKPYIRWVVVVACLGFVGQAAIAHWQSVSSFNFDRRDIALLIASGLVTLVAHCWAGWVWGWIVRELGQPVSGVQAARIYLRTNIAKYAPGNVWHFYGRVTALKSLGSSLGAATLSTALEPLLMAAAAFLVAIAGLRWAGGWAIAIGLVLVLIGIHPRWLNRVARLLEKKASQTDTPARLQSYPLKPLLGEVGFVLLRSVGFLAIALALSPLPASQFLAVTSGFSVAWVLGLVIPGAPGGLGVFEATAIALMQGQLDAGVLVQAVALYRLIGTLAEILGAGLAVIPVRHS